MNCKRRGGFIEKLPRETVRRRGLHNLYIIPVARGNWEETMSATGDQKMNDFVRIGMVGLGQIGAAHADHIAAGCVPRLRLTAVVSRNAAWCERHPEVTQFDTVAKLLERDIVDAVVIATPHPEHPATGILALDAGRHVLVEKPIASRLAEGERFIAHSGGGQVCAVMFDARTNPFYRKIHEVLKAGELGRLSRFDWVFTTCYRKESYYRSAGWRGTWAGEGGGVLINQCAHHLDLIAWFFGMPTAVRGFCKFGRHHDIEVEDEATGYFEFSNGFHGTFIASTGEVPGTNRLEIVGDRGRLMLEDDELWLVSCGVSSREYLRDPSEGALQTRRLRVPVEQPRQTNRHHEIFLNLGEAITENAPLIAPAIEGLRSLELANALVLSTWTDSTVRIGSTRDAYEELLARKLGRQPALPG